MDHSIQNYLKKLPTEVLVAFVEEVEQNQTENLYSSVLSDIRKELALREEENRKSPTLS